MDTFRFYLPEQMLSLFVSIPIALHETNEINQLLLRSYLGTVLDIIYSTEAQHLSRNKLGIVITFGLEYRKSRWLLFSKYSYILTGRHA